MQGTSPVPSPAPAVGPRQASRWHPCCLGDRNRLVAPRPRQGSGTPPASRAACQGAPVTPRTGLLSLLRPARFSLGSLLPPWAQVCLEKQAPLGVFPMVPGLLFARLSLPPRLQATPCARRLSCGPFEIWHKGAPLRSALRGHILFAEQRTTWCFNGKKGMERERLGRGVAAAK